MLHLKEWLKVSLLVYKIVLPLNSSKSECSFSNTLFFIYQEKFNNILNLVCVLMIWFSRWCAATSRQDHGNSWQLFPRNIGLNFLVMTGRYLYIFTDLLWWTGKWMLSAQKVVNQSSLMKDFIKQDYHMLTSSKMHIYIE